MRLIEPLADRELPKLYDTELMLGGGHIAGYAVEGELAARTAEQIARMQAESGGFFLAVGDGNHSLATAKACWEAIKPTLPTSAGRSSRAVRALRAGQPAARADLPTRSPRGLRRGDRRAAKRVLSGICARTA